MKKTPLLLISLTIIVLSITSCGTKEKGPSIDFAGMTDQPVSIEEMKFMDGFGRQILFNGINLVNKNPKVNYIGPEGPETFENFRKWGFNVIRLGIIWDGLEPEPGVYNEAYLKEIDKQIEMARENGIFVFLDMHQDLFSVKYSDGAPEWATLDEGKEHIKGEIWSDAYLISPAVQTAWDNFWNNTPVNGGKGVQDYYADAWQHVAQRYAGNHTVIGYDIMNEPFPGSEAQMYLPVLFNAYIQLLREEDGKEVTLEEVAAMWQNQETRYETLKNISSKERFSKVMDALYPLNSQFEQGPLQAFYQKVANAIRQVDATKILFLNHTYFCNSGVPTALEPVKNIDGTTDTLVAYGAHGYDLLVDTKNLSQSSTDRLELIFERINEGGNRMNVPILIGEWGALGSDSPGRTRLAHTNLDIFEKFNFSNTYWAYNLGIEEFSYFKNALVRPYPAYISGELISYAYDRETGRFHCKWKETPKVQAPTSIYVPRLSSVNKDELTLSPEGEGIVIEPFNGSAAGYITLYPIGTGDVREVSFIIEEGAEQVISISSKE